MNTPDSHRFHRRCCLGGVGLAAAKFLLPVQASASAHAPQESRLFVLSDGRRLGYAQYGDPQGVVTILYFHGMPMSRIEARVIDAAARAERCSVIAMDRPGIGLSTYQSCRRVWNWTDDVREFVSGRQLGEFAVMGVSSGGPYALACAQRAFDGALKSVAVVNGVAPQGAPVDAGEASRYFSLTKRMPGIAHLVLRRTRTVLCRNPRRATRLAISRMSPPDQAMLCAPAYQQAFMDAYLQATRCGTAGIVSELQLLACPWGFPLKDVGQPVRLWYGKCDRTTPPAIGHYLAARLPNAELRVFPGEGHVSMLAGAAIREILRAIVSDSRA